MEFNFDSVNIIISTVIALNLSLGVVVFLTKKESRINQSFLMFLLAATFWCVSMVLFRGFSGSEYNILLSRILYVSASLIPLSFIYFINVFPKKQHNLPKIFNFLLPIPTAFIVFLSIYKYGLINGIVSISSREPIILFDIPYHTVYAIYIVLYFSICYLLLFIKYLKFEGVEKKQIEYIIFGTLLSTIIGITSNLFMPYFNDFRLNWLGQASILFMISAVSFAIVKHRLFNLKIVATQYIVFVLCIVLLVRTLLSSSVSDLTINIVFLLIMIFIGILLIKSVIQEVTLREKTEEIDEQLKIANAGQANLIRFMNHQIKGRLGNIKNIFAELMTGDYGVMPEKSKILLEKGLDEANLGVNYVQNILKGASAENGTLMFNMREINFREIVEKVFQKQQIFAKSKGLSFELSIEDGDYNITGDDIQLTEAVKNMIDNSILYTPKGGVKVYLYEEKQKLFMKIEDTGVGLSEDDKNRLFKFGGRGADALKINVNSTGYGLVFVKNVIETHKGSVSAESEGIGKGSKFILELPKHK